MHKSCPFPLFFEVKRLTVVGQAEAPLGLWVVPPLQMQSMSRDLTIAHQPSAEALNPDGSWLWADFLQSLVCIAFGAPDIDTTQGWLCPGFSSGGRSVPCGHPRCVHEPMCQCALVLAL